MNERLTRRSQIAAVPDDPRRKLKSGHDRPLLVAVSGDGAAAESVEPNRAWWIDIARLVGRHDAAAINSPARALLSSLDRAARVHLR
jgi:hypothetical protein